MATVYRRTGYVKDPKTGERVRRKYGRWIGQYVDADGVERRVPLFRGKAAAQQMLAELVRGVERERAGLTDPFEGHRRRQIGRAHV